MDRRELSINRRAILKVFLKNLPTNDLLVKESTIDSEIPIEETIEKEISIDYEVVEDNHLIDKSIDL